MDYEYLEQHIYIYQNDVWVEITEKLREYRFDQITPDLFGIV